MMFPSSTTLSLKEQAEFLKADSFILVFLLSHSEYLAQQSLAAFHSLWQKMQNATGHPQGTSDNPYVAVQIQH